MAENPDDSPAVRNGRVRRAVLVLAAYAVFALAATYPLILRFGTHVVGAPHGDAKTYLWNFWWVWEALVEIGTSPFETSYLFYPLGIGLSLHTLGFLQGAAAIPLRALFGDIQAVNLVVLWTFVASAGFTYALARRVGASPSGAFLAGVVFAFCPYRLSRLAGHYDLLGTEWIPLYALLLIGVAEARRFPSGRVVAAAAVAAACGYTALSYLVFLGLFTIVFLLLHRAGPRALAPRAFAILAHVVVFLSPLLAQMARDVSRWSYAPYPGADRYAADLAAYFLPGEGQSLLGSYIGRAFDANATEATVFVGYVVVLLTLAALVRFARGEDRAALGPWLLAGGVFFVLGLGGELTIGGHDTGIPLPFRLVSAIPLLEHLRAPSRFAVVVMLCLAVVAGLTWTKWTRRLPGWAAALVTALGGVLVLAEYGAWPTPVFAPEAHPVYERIARSERRATVVEIPGIEQDPGEIMFHQTIHRNRVFVGTAARVPLEKSEYYQGLHFVRPLIDLRKGRIEPTSELLDRERVFAPHAARFLDVGFLVLDKAYAKRGVIDFVEAVLPVDRTFEDDTLVLLETRDEELPLSPRVIDAGSSLSRQHFESGWLRPEGGEVDGSGFRWANRERSTILFRRPPGRAQELVVVLAPLERTSLSVELEIDGGERSLETLREGWQELRLSLPDAPGDGVERLWMRWSVLERVSARDPRRVGARVREIRFE